MFLLKVLHPDCHSLCVDCNLWRASLGTRGKIFLVAPPLYRVLMPGVQA